MLSSVVFLGLLVVVSRLIGAEDEGVAGGIIAVTFINPAVRSFVVLAVVLLGSNPAIMVDSGSNIYTMVQ
jgi:hypothetical protein